MEILRFKNEEFNLENFIHYYSDNIEELLFEYPNYVSRVCLIDRDYINLLKEGEYSLHFVVGKTYESAEKIELLNGQIYGLNHYMEDDYEADNTIKDIGDFSLNLDNLIGLLFEVEDDEIVVHPVDFEHGGEISQPRIRKVDYCGDIEKILLDILDKFLINN